MTSQKPTIVNSGPTKRDLVAGILRERAARLAARRTTADSHVPTVPMLVVRAGEERLGLLATAVRELTRLDGVTPVPGAHPHLLGVINLHNDLVSLINPLGLAGDAVARAPQHPFTHAVLLRHERLRLALACHDVVGIEQVPADVWHGERTFQSGADLTLLLPEAHLFSQYDPTLVSPAVP